MPKWISRDSNFREIIKLIFQKVESSPKILNNIIIIGTSLIMLNKSTPKNFPILSFQQLLNIILNLLILLHKPFLKKTHLTIKKRSMCLLTSLSILLTMNFTLSKYTSYCVEDLLHWIETVLTKIWMYFTLVWLRIVVTV